MPHDPEALNSEEREAREPGETGDDVEAHIKDLGMSDAGMQDAGMQDPGFKDLGRNDSEA